ncbi:MAG: GGDEF domain-containing protein [Bacilli bacterium]|nr:GGDEF domain-containing protein [Bacilli bacterium]
MAKPKDSIYYKNHVTNSEIAAAYINRYRKIYIAITLVIALFEAIMAIRGLIFFNWAKPRHVAYFVCYIVLLAASIATATFLILGIKKEQSQKSLNLMINTYSTIMITWAVVMSVLDLVGGNYPIIYLTIVIVIGGISPINPWIYIPTTFVTSAALIVFNHFFGRQGVLQTSDFINIFVFIVMSIFVAYRNYSVTLSEERNRKELTRLSKVDILTGLDNENSYYTFLDDLEKIKDPEYAVIVLDLNRLKYTDDTYGHRFGAFLISEVGRILPTIFDKSALFHTGGDEFVIVVLSQYKELDELVKKLDEKLEYTEVEYEGQKLILSIARGVSRHEPGESYNDTYQRADRDMYVNKKEVKKKHNIEGR